MLTGIIFVIIGIVVAIVGVGILMNREAFSGFAAGMARQNTIFGKRAAERNASNQTPNTAIFFGVVVIVIGLAFVAMGFVVTSS